MKNIAIFASGTGSNFLAINKAITNKELHANISLLVSDKPQSKAVENAQKLKIETFAFHPKDYPNKQAFEKEIVSKLESHNVDLIVLAGYMRLIGPTLLHKYPNKIINIHPSYLPAYKGLDAVGQALKDKPRFTGVTVHYVDEGMDTGTIIDQVKVLMTPNETRATLEAKIHHIEHQLYPKVIQKVLGEQQ